MDILYSDRPTRICDTVTPGFPWTRYQSRKFVWEDALIDGNYFTVFSSAQAMGSSRERILDLLELKRTDHLSRHFAFEVAVDGMILRRGFELVGQERFTTPEGFEEHIVSLDYPRRQVRIKVHTLLDGSSFMVRYLEIQNIGDKPCAVTGLFPLAGVVYPEVLGNTFKAEHLRADYQIGSFLDNHYLGEGEFHWQDLPKGTLKFNFERALFNPPMYVIRDNDYCVLTLIHIETTMMTQAEFFRGGEPRYNRCSVGSNDYVHFKAGVDERAVYRTLHPGESAESPKIHFGQVYGDLDTAVNELNDHLRISVIPKRSQKIKFPVEFNHSGYTQCSQIPYGRLIEEVDMAAAVGAELFVVDAGWFGHKDKSYHEQRGDWFEHELLTEGGGLKGVFDYARGKGLMCGLWMEVEAMQSASELARKHPEWAARAYGRALPHLNLLLPEAYDYVYNTLDRVISEYRLDLFRIDGGLKEPLEMDCSDRIEGASWAYYEKLYEIIERLRKKYPRLYLENCSGGGGRSDLAMMRRFDWLQVTDNFAPVAQLRTVYGMSLALAPEQILSLTGSGMKHQTDADFQARTSIFGRPEITGIADAADRINPETLKAWKKALHLYKNELRDMLGSCRIYHHTPPERYMERGKFLTLELASAERDKSFSGIFRLEGCEEDTYRLIPRGIGISGNYEVYFDNTEEKIVLSGYCLLNEGIKVRLAGKLTSEIIVIKRLPDRKF